MAHLVKGEVYTHVCTGADPANKVSGVISVIFSSLVSLQVHCFKRDEACFTTLVWQNNGRQKWPYIANPFI